jgi:hypothetical protein
MFLAGFKLSLFSFFFYALPNDKSIPVCSAYYEPRGAWTTTGRLLTIKPSRAWHFPSRLCCRPLEVALYWCCGRKSVGERDRGRRLVSSVSVCAEISNNKKRKYPLPKLNKAVFTRQWCERAAFLCVHSLSHFYLLPSRNLSLVITATEQK